MIKNLSRGAAVALTGSAVALIGTMLPAQAATTSGWRAAATVNVKGQEAVFTTVDAVSARNAWAAGFAATASGKNAAGLIEHWAGKSWQRVALPAKVARAWAKAGPSFVTLGALSSTNVWAFDEFPSGSGSEPYLRLSGRKWTVGTIPGTDAARGHFVLVTSVQVLGKAGVWVFGGQLKVTGSQQPSLVPYVAHFNGSKWTTEKVTGTGEITAVSAISPGNMWAVTGSEGLAAELSSSASTPTVLHWNGNSWRPASVQPAGLSAGSDLTSITAARGNKLWIGGDVRTKSGGTVADFVVQFNGASWGAPVDLPRSGATAAASGRMPYQIESLVPDGAGGLWALSGNLAPAAPKLWHYVAGKWSLPASPSFGSAHRALLQLAAVPGARGSVWAAGTVGKQASGKGLIAITGPTPRRGTSAGQPARLRAPATMAGAAGRPMRTWTGWQGSRCGP